MMMMIYFFAFSFLQDVSIISNLIPASQVAS